MVPTASYRAQEKKTQISGELRIQLFKGGFFVLFVYLFVSLFFVLFQNIRQS